MLEYLFFNKKLCDIFIEFLTRKAIDYEVSDHEAGYSVGVPENIDDALGGLVDEQYENLLQAHVDELDDENGFEKNVAGVGIELADGTPCTIRIDPDLMSRMLNEISLEELRDMIHDIAKQMENPDNRPLCHT
ncbi:hypothetical protein BOW53_04470 [Solemya pervernicosa gill symbiont]|uniref:Uncharacterized protein n=2 Tax=Gammaproteobacteria incertae sedis TaxID=118884 RepID=A0A1T2L808_9GAMM|nr:hypothetical protein [Candidatus Reidiella endopervernicosa]OOZ41239.1 hypothetical protein BOW53_04470 [Solemya pervernicosa gill symbiont]QKQ25277.1 hypothetical protein HUE57_02460 [Candidatus Reidiella endopervernicosa]